MWREGLGMWKILTEDKKGYRNHPATKEFEDYTGNLWWRLYYIHKEMMKRGYKPKDVPTCDSRYRYNKHLVEWQTLEEQIEVLKAKGCKCRV